MAVQFEATIKKFGQKGEKTGWNYIEISKNLANQLFPLQKKSFKTKGYLDYVPFQGKSLTPMGAGNFILAINKELRKKIGKEAGGTIRVKLELDTQPIIICQDLLLCLKDEPGANDYFNHLAPSHQKYFSNWIESAKTAETKFKRIAHTVNACMHHKSFSNMLRSLKMSSG